MSASRPRVDGPVLLIGASGQVGAHLRSHLVATRPVVALTHADLDLRNEERIRDAVRHHVPSIVINAAAYTRVDDAERDNEACWAVNALAPAVLAEESEAVGALMVDFSTNYVFDGEGDRAYRESDAVGPLSAYGRSKAEGERRIAGANPRHIVIRTHGVYDTRGTNFLRRILALAHERDQLQVVDDQIGAPTPAALLARSVAQILDAASRRGWSRDDYGIVHVTTLGEASWFDFARRALALDPDRARQRCSVLRPVPSSEYPTPARRPLNGRLDTSRAREHFGLSLPTWDTALAEVMRQLRPT